MHKPLKLMMVSLIGITVRVNLLSMVDAIAILVNLNMVFRTIGSRNLHMRMVNQYNGEWKEWKLLKKEHGQGTYISTDGDKYVGEWK